MVAASIGGHNPRQYFCFSHLLSVSPQLAPALEIWDHSMPRAFKALATVSHVFYPYYIYHYRQRNSRTHRIRTSNCSACTKSKPPLGGLLPQDPERLWPLCISRFIHLPSNKTSTLSYLLSLLRKFFSATYSIQCIRHRPFNMISSLTLPSALSRFIKFIIFLLHPSFGKPLILAEQTSSQSRRAQ